MVPKFIALLIFVYVIGLLLGSVTTGANMFGNSTMTNPIQELESYKTAITEVNWGQMILPTFWFGFFGAFLDVAMLNLPLFGDPASPMYTLKWIVVAPITGMAVFGMVMLLYSILQIVRP